MLEGLETRVERIRGLKAKYYIGSQQAKKVIDVRERLIRRSESVARELSRTTTLDISHDELLEACAMLDVLTETYAVAFERTTGKSCIPQHDWVRWSYQYVGSDFDKADLERLANLLAQEDRYKTMVDHVAARGMRYAQIRTSEAEAYVCATAFMVEAATIDPNRFDAELARKQYFMELEVELISDDDIAGKLQNDQLLHRLEYKRQIAQFFVDRFGVRTYDRAVLLARRKLRKEEMKEKEARKDIRENGDTKYCSQEIEDSIIDGMKDYWEPSIKAARAIVYVISTEKRFIERYLAQKHPSNL